MIHGRRVAAALAALGVWASPAAALDPSPRAVRPSASAPLQFLHTGPVGGIAHIAQIADPQGRQVLLRGVNVDGLVDYWRADLKRSYPVSSSAYAHRACPRDDPSVEGAVLCQRDFAQMRPLGYNAIRLNLSWSLLEPKPGHIDQTYIDRIAQVVGWARRAGIYVILDMHQDAWSKYLYSTSADHCTAPYQSIRGYDGAPAWASLHTKPVCALGGTRELDPAVEEDFAKFFGDAPAPDGVGLQEHFIAVVTALARRFRNDPTVAGYDLFNEPTYFQVPGTDATVLLPFYAKVIGAVSHRVHDFRQLFMIEPGAVRDVTDVSNITASWASFSHYRGVVYEPHVYTRTFTPRSFPMDGGYRSSIADAQHLGLPVWVGEFGCNPSDDATVLTAHYAEQDAFGLSGSLWLWKENANDTNPKAFWGVYGPPFGAGVPQLDRIRLSARVYPLATAGDLHALSYDAAGSRFTMTASSKRVRVGVFAHATIVAIPARVHGVVRAHGANAVVVPRFGGGRLAYVFPSGGTYRVTVG